MLWDKHYISFKDIIPKHTTITRQIPAGQVEIHLQENTQIDLSAEAKNKVVYSYV
jgi:hypothetical protein